MAHAASTSSTRKASISLMTAVASSVVKDGTETVASKASVRPMSSKTSLFDVVPMTSNFFPFGGCLLMSTSKACKTTLENLGPMETYSNSRSKSSKTNKDKLDLYASSNTFANVCTLLISLCPIIESALTIFMNGNSAFIANVAASAVLPQPTPPSNKHASFGVFSLTRTCSTNAEDVPNNFSNREP